MRIVIAALTVTLAAGEKLVYRDVSGQVMWKAAASAAKAVAPRNSR